MKNVFKLFALVAVFLFASCGGSEPKDLAEEAAGYLQDKDFQSFVALMTDENNPEANKDQAMFIGLIQDKMSKELDRKEGISSYKVGKQVIDEEKGKASVEVEFTYGDGSTDKDKFKFEKREGKWYLTM